MSSRRGLTVAVLALFGIAGALAWASSRRHSVASHNELDPRDPAALAAGAGRSAGPAPRGADSAASAVVFRVIDEQGDPVDHGTVSLRCLEDDEVREIPGGVVELGEDGEVRAIACRAMVCVELHHPTLRRADPWVLRPGEPAVLRARALSRLHGTVDTDGGRPVAGATVIISSPEDGDPHATLPTVARTTTTDADGVFTIALVERPPCDPCLDASQGCADGELPVHERVRITATIEGFAPTMTEVEVSGDPVELRVVAADDALVGVLLDPRGQAYPRAFVFARSLERPGEQHRAVVDGDAFAFESLGAGTYGLRAVQDGIELASVDDVRTGDDVKLRGVRLAHGPDVVVDVGAVSDVHVDGGPFRDARTDMQGRVRADDVMPGHYVIRLRPHGARESIVHEFEIADRGAAAGQGDTAVHIRVDLRAGAAGVRPASPRGE